MLDQAERLRSLAKDNLQWNDNYIEINESKEGSAGTKIVTITSGKGGVGKSNFAVNLGISLQKMGKKVLILDGDIGMGNDDVLMGFLPRYSIYDIIFSNKTIDEVLIQGPYGVKLLPAGTGVNDINGIDEDKRQELLDKLEKLSGFDFILMDTGAGINKNVLAFINSCDELIIVTTPEPTSLTDAYSLMKAIINTNTNTNFKLKEKVRVVVNKVLDYEEGLKTFNKFSNATKKFLKVELDHLGNISEDRKIMESVRSQKPVVVSAPNCKAALDIEEIALKLCGYNKKAKSYGVQGLFNKIFNDS